MTHPVWGNGYYSTYAITGEIWTTPLGAHGLPALLLGETGLIGTAIFLWLIGRFFRATGRAKRRSTSFEQRGFWQAARWTMAAMLLFGLFHQVDQIPQFYVLLAWGTPPATPS